MNNDTTTTDQIISRIDDVLRDNKRIEYIFIGLTTVLFLAGIACLISAIVNENFIWSIPSVLTTALLQWPLKEIKRIRQKNIALATAPMLITRLPGPTAAEEIQKLLQNLYQDEN